MKKAIEASLNARSIRVTVNPERVDLEICTFSDVSSSQYPGKFIVSEMLEIVLNLSLARKNMEFYFYPPGLTFPANFLKPRFSALFDIPSHQLFEFGKEEISRSGINLTHAILSDYQLDSPRGQILLLNGEIFHSEKLRNFMQGIFLKSGDPKKFNIWFFSFRGIGSFENVFPQVQKLLARAYPDRMCFEEEISRSAKIQKSGEPSLREMTDRISRINKRFSEDKNSGGRNNFQVGSAVRPKPGPPLSVRFSPQPMPKISSIDISVSKEELRNFQVLCQVQRKFILANLNGRLFAIDQHAAAERVNLNFLNSQLSKIRGSKRINFKQKISKSQGIFLERARNSLERSGWIFRISGCDLEISSAPAIGMISCRGEEIFEAAESEAPLRRILATAACHRSVKFGDFLEISSSQKLVTDLAECDFPFQCAHGRPTIFPLPFLDLEI